MKKYRVIYSEEWLGGKEYVYEKDTMEQAKKTCRWFHSEMKLIGKQRCYSCNIYEIER